MIDQSWSSDSQEPESREEDGGGSAESRSSPVALLVAMLAMVVCCGLPFLIIAAGGLASLSLITGRYALPFAGGAIVVAMVVVAGIAIRTRSRKSKLTKTNGEACCE